jgi:hypothetical protein
VAQYSLEKRLRRGFVTGFRESARAAFAPFSGIQALRALSHIENVVLTTQSCSGIVVRASLWQAGGPHDCMLYTLLELKGHLRHEAATT